MLKVIRSHVSLNLIATPPLVNLARNQQMSDTTKDSSSKRWGCIFSDFYAVSNVVKPSRYNDRLLCSLTMASIVEVAQNVHNVDRSILMNPSACGVAHAPFSNLFETFRTVLTKRGRYHEAGSGLHSALVDSSSGGSTGTTSWRVA